LTASEVSSKTDSRFFSTGLICGNLFNLIFVLLIIC